MISRFQRDMDLAIRLCEMGFDGELMSDITGLPLSFLKEFAGCLRQGDPKALFNATQAARECPDAESASLVLRTGLSAFGLQPSAVDRYILFMDQELSG